MRSPVARALPLLIAFVATGAFAQEALERRDHRGSVGLLVAVSGERKDHATANGLGADSGFRVGTELGGTLQFGTRDNEAAAAVRTLFGGPLVDLMVRAGFRRFFGLEEWKTFFELDLAAHVTPLFAIGPRVGLGAQYDFSSIAGVYAVLGAQLGFGNGLRFGAELMLGIQLRSYLFE